MWHLHQYPLCPFSRKVRLLLGEKGVGYELVRESPWERRDEFVDLIRANLLSLDGAQLLLMTGGLLLVLVLLLRCWAGLVAMAI